MGLRVGVGVVLRSAPGSIERAFEIGAQRHFHVALPFTILAVAAR